MEGEFKVIPAFRDAKRAGEEAVAGDDFHGEEEVGRSLFVERVFGVPGGEDKTTLGESPRPVEFTGGRRAVRNEFPEWFPFSVAPETVRMERQGHAIGAQDTRLAQAGRFAPDVVFKGKGTGGRVVVRLEDK